MRDCFVWDVMPGGIYFVPADSPKMARYFDFATGRTRICFPDWGFGSGFSLSPDGRYLLYSARRGGLGHYGDGQVLMMLKKPDILDFANSR